MTTPTFVIEETVSDPALSLQDMDSKQLTHLLEVAQEALQAAEQAESYAALLKAKQDQDLAKADAGQLVLNAENTTDENAKTAAAMIQAWLTAVEDENKVKGHFAEIWGETFVIARHEQKIPPTLAALREDGDHTLSISDIVSIATRAVELERELAELKSNNETLAQANGDLRKKNSELIEANELHAVMNEVLKGQLQSLSALASRGMKPNDYAQWQASHKTADMAKAVRDARLQTQTKNGK